MRDIVVLPFRFIADGEPMPDLSTYRDPIILRARFVPGDTDAEPDMAESARLRRVDPPIRPVYPEAWLLGGYFAGRLSLNLLRAVARRALAPGPAELAPMAEQVPADASPAPAPAGLAEPVPLEHFHVSPRQI